MPCAQRPPMGAGEDPAAHTGEAVTCAVGGRRGALTPCLPASPPQVGPGERRRGRRRGGAAAECQPRLRPPVPARHPAGVHPVPHDVIRGRRPGGPHAGPRLAGGGHRPGQRLHAGGGPPSGTHGGQQHAGGPGAGHDPLQGRHGGTAWAVNVHAPGRGFLGPRPLGSTLTGPKHTLCPSPHPHPLPETPPSEVSAFHFLLAKDLPASPVDLYQPRMARCGPGEQVWVRRGAEEGAQEREFWDLGTQF